MGVYVLLLPELSISILKAFGDKDRIPSEAFRAPRLVCDGPPYLPEKGTYGAICSGDRDGADGTGRAVFVSGEHLQEALFPDALQKPPRQSARQAVPGLEDNARVLGEYRVIRVAQSPAGSSRFSAGYLHNVQPLRFGEIEGGGMQIRPEDLRGLAGLVVVRGHEEGFHPMKSTISASHMVESLVCAR
jgi:hypothetical protein